MRRFLSGVVHPSGGAKGSSFRWLQRQINDPYVIEARYRNYRARSAFKLIEIDSQYKLLKPGTAVLDCGCAPGAWCQVAAQKMGVVFTDEVKVRGKGGRMLKPEYNLVNQHISREERAKSLVIGIDINALHPIEGVHLLSHCDFTQPMNQARILNILDGRKLDVILSDMAPEASGVKTMDHERIMKLNYSALHFAVQNLVSLKENESGGSFLCKVWDGNLTNKLMQDLGNFFTLVKSVKPLSSRKESKEHYIIAMGFQGLNETSQ